ncbi:MAG: tyrosine-type recombinase/integrase [Rhodobacteraceae bacterium]|nr:tyrosine-type recombinase/integrase [Paracoccaceae bacterium]MCZ8083040.1 tyrosine-type recombinase/integrase [Paracoccaceae bacterium]
MAGRSVNTFEFSINKINKLKAPTDRDKVVYHDLERRELSLSVFRSGEMYFGCYYTIIRDGKRKTAYYNMGVWRNWSIDDARKTAEKIKSVGQMGWDYKDYLKAQDEIIGKKKTLEQVEVSLSEVGGLPGQLGKAWDDLCKRKQTLDKEGQQKLAGTYRKHVIAHWPETTWINEITEQSVIEWKMKFLEKQTTWNQLRVYLNMVFKDEIYNRRLQVNPLERVEAYNLKEGFCILSNAGVDNFIDLFVNPEIYPEYQRNYCRYVMLLLLTGQRPINLRSLKKVDDGKTNYVDYDDMQFVYRIHKTDKKSKTKAQKVGFSDEVLEILLAAKAENDESEWAIPSCDTRDRYKKTPLSEERGREFFNRYRDQLETIGDSDLTLYKLRHTFATRLMANGVERARIAKLLLHSANSRSTGRYARILDDDMREVVKVAASMFNLKREKLE